MNTDVADGNLRLEKTQKARWIHDCSECPEPIESGTKYIRLALPPSPAAFPPVETVDQEDAWKWVDGSWEILKMHKACHRRKYGG